MWWWMPRSFRPLRRLLPWAAPALLAALPGCPGPAAVVQLELSAGPGAPSADIKALRFLVRELDADAPEVFGPIPLDREQPLRLAAEVTPSSPFYIDVWACPDVESCAPADVIARGCTPVLEVEGDTSLSLTLYASSDARAAECPPEI